MFCKHKWELIIDKTTESMQEHHTRVTGISLKPKNTVALKELSSKKSIIILKCNNCGKLNKTITNI